MSLEDAYPRSLTPLEKDLLLWVLPGDRPGYREYRTLADSWHVVGIGRRGVGNYILAAPENVIDIESPLPQVFAYGIVETGTGNIAVTIRERLGDQLEYEIVNLQGEGVSEISSEKRRWTFSTWTPSMSCPIGGDPLRKIEIRSVGLRRYMLALCPIDKRLWVYDESSGVNHPIPVTNFYNELMLHTNNRDPKVALDAKRLFSDLGRYSDTDFTKAFVSYNAQKTKVTFIDPVQIVESNSPTWLRWLRSLVKKQ
jgi:hypothetical protein